MPLAVQVVQEVFFFFYFESHKTQNSIFNEKAKFKESHET